MGKGTQQGQANGMQFISKTLEKKAYPPHLMPWHSEIFKSEIDREIDR